MIGRSAWTATWLLAACGVVPSPTLPTSEGPAAEEMLVGRVVDARGVPLPGIHVRQLLTDDELCDLDVPIDWDHGGFLDLLPGAMTNDDGGFELRRWVPPIDIGEDDAPGDRPGPDAHGANGAPVRLFVCGPGVASRIVDSTGDEPLEVTLTPEARITGRVVDEAGRPLAGVRACVAEVEWFDDVALAREDYETFAATLCTETGVDGRFAIERLPTGSVHLRLERLLGDAVLLEDVGFPRAESFDVGDVVLEAGVRLAGRVTDRDGGPVPLALVVVMEAGRDMDELALEEMPHGLSALLRTEDVLVVKCDAEGRFTVDGLDGDPVGVLVLAEEYAPAGFHDVEPSREGVDLQLVPAATLLVRVRDASSGAPLAAARVEATRHPSHTAEDEVLLPVASGVDLARRVQQLELHAGDRLVIGVGEGENALEVTAPGYERRWLAWRGGHRSADQATLEIALDREAWLTGTITNHAGQPLVGARVTLTPMDDHLTSDWRLHVARTDERGVYRFGRLSAVAWRLWRPWPADSPDPIVSLDAGQEREFDLVVPGGTGRIHGAVSMRSGAPLPDCEVRLAWAHLAGRSTYTVGKTTTSQDGRFAFDDLGPGDYQVAADRLVHRVVSLSAGDRLQADLQLKRALVSVQGRLLLDGQPVKGQLSVSQDWHSQAGGSTVRTDSWGAFQVRRLVNDPERDVPLLITATSDDRRGRGDAFLSLPPDVLIEHDIVLEPSSSGIRGQVVDHVTGVPRARRQVLLWGKGRDAWTDEQGRFAFPSVTPGRISLRVIDDGYSGMFNVQVTEAGTLDATLRMPRVAALEGRVDVPEDWPAGRSVGIAAYPLDDLAPVGGAPLYSVPAVQDRFRFDVLPVGRYQIVPSTWSTSKGTYVPLPDDLREALPVVTLVEGTSVEALVQVRVLD